MSKIVACIDGRSNSAVVTDWAIWAAKELSVYLELLHVLERPVPILNDYSGSLGFGEQESLLKSLSRLDEQHSKLAQEAGRGVLNAAQSRAVQLGLGNSNQKLRHGDLVETLLDDEGETSLFVMGVHTQVHSSKKIHFDYTVERVIRSVKKPVLVVKGNSFSPPDKVLIGFDGSLSSQQMIKRITQNKLTQGKYFILGMVGIPTKESAFLLSNARLELEKAGAQVLLDETSGITEEVLPMMVKKHHANILIMGAYGHSRIRQLVVGSTTSTLLRISEIPILILR